ncbi:hypothetical protein RND81_08G197700 [Saponaria officinalis]|uniref:Uncharacterized protein n=1 Tax=Saponaria officinalis TaxID=3572 RepID=A0AAW1JAC4_SAPOF
MGKPIVAAFLIGLIFFLGINSEIAYGDKCCQDHWDQGSCVAGKDDSPEIGGKCWNFCTSDCTKGGRCKQYGSKTVCHCYC